MGINVILEQHADKQVKEIEQIVDWDEIVVALLPDWNDLSYPCIRLIDPYGDVKLSSKQMTTFLEEWERLKYNARTPEQIEVWSQVKTLAIKCQNQSSQRLRFLGD